MSSTPLQVPVLMDFDPLSENVGVSVKSAVLLNFPFSRSMPMPNVTGRCRLRVAETVPEICAMGFRDGTKPLAVAVRATASMLAWMDGQFRFAPAVKEPVAATVTSAPAAILISGPMLAILGMTMPAMGIAASSCEAILMFLDRLSATRPTATVACMLPDRPMFAAVRPLEIVKVREPTRVSVPAPPQPAHWTVSAPCWNSVIV